MVGGEQNPGGTHCCSRETIRVGRLCRKTQIMRTSAKPFEQEIACNNDADLARQVAAEQICEVGAHFKFKQII